VELTGFADIECGSKGEDNPGGLACTRTTLSEVGQKGGRSKLGES
jgi:hypothetical protein